MPQDSVHFFELSEISAFFADFAKAHKKLLELGSDFEPAEGIKISFCSLVPDRSGDHVCVSFWCQAAAVIHFSFAQDVPRTFQYSVQTRSIVIFFLSSFELGDTFRLTMT